MSTVYETEEEKQRKALNLDAYLKEVLGGGAATAAAAPPALSMEWSKEGETLEERRDRMAALLAQALPAHVGTEATSAAVCLARLAEEVSYSAYYEPRDSRKIKLAFEFKLRGARATAPATRGDTAAEVQEARETADADREDARADDAVTDDAVTDDAAAESVGAKTFETSGMLWFVNRLLAPFGWRLNVTLDVNRGGYRITVRQVPGSMFTPGTPEEALRVHFLKGIDADIARVRTDVTELSAADQALVGAVETLCDFVDEKVDAEYLAQAQARLKKASAATPAPSEEAKREVVQGALTDFVGRHAPQGWGSPLPPLEQVQHDENGVRFTHLKGVPCLLCAPKHAAAGPLPPEQYATEDTGALPPGYVRTGDLPSPASALSVLEGDPNFDPTAFLKHERMGAPDVAVTTLLPPRRVPHMEGDYARFSDMPRPGQTPTSAEVKDSCAKVAGIAPPTPESLLDSRLTAIQAQLEALAAPQKAAQEAAQAVRQKLSPDALSPITDVWAAVHAAQDALADLELVRAENNIELTRLTLLQKRLGGPHVPMGTVEHNALTIAQKKDDELAVEIERAKAALHRAQIAQDRATRRMFTPARPRMPHPPHINLPDLRPHNPYAAPEVARDGRGLPTQPVGVIPPSEVTGGGIGRVVGGPTVGEGVAGLTVGEGVAGLTVGATLPGVHGYFRTGASADQGEYGSVQSQAAEAQQQALAQEFFPSRK